MTRTQIAPGYIVINASSASGGITYEREEVTEEAHRRGRVVSLRHTKRIDNEHSVRAIDAAVKDVDHILRTACVRLINVGHFATVDVLAAVEDRVAVLAQKVNRLNAEAIQRKSAHRGMIHIVTAMLDLTREGNRQIVYQTARDTIGELRSSLRIGDVVDDRDETGAIARRHQLRSILLRAKNLDALFVGPLQASVRNALDRVKTARVDLLKRITNGESPVDAGAAIDLTALDTVMARFDELLA